MARDGDSAREVESRLLSFLRRELVPDRAVDRDDELLAGELLDSVGVLRLAAFVEEELGVVVQPADFVIENFQSVAALAGYVERARAAGGPAAG